MRKFLINACVYEAEDCQRGVFIDPVLPAGFHSTANEDRPFSHMLFWQMPYIVTDGAGGFCVKCLDGGAWDRPTHRGHRPTLEAALDLAQELRTCLDVMEARDIGGGIMGVAPVSAPAQ